MRHHRALTALAGAALLAACGDARQVTGPSCEQGPLLAAAPAPVPATSLHDALFERAGAEFGVPAALLRSIGYVESRWQMVEGAEEFPGLPPAHGIMGLRGERLLRGAALAGVSLEAARTDAAANVRAAAALLGAHADELGTDRASLDAWAPAVARFSGIATAGARESYVRDHVYPTLRGRVPPSPALSRVADPKCGAPTSPTDPVDFAGAVWRPSPNYNQRMAGEGGKVHMVIIHVEERSTWSSSTPARAATRGAGGGSPTRSPG